MEKDNNICMAMKVLEKEQKIISEQEVEFQFICTPPSPDTIPFMLFGCKDSEEPFTAYCISSEGCVKTPFFRLEKLDEERCCAELSLLKAVDMDGWPTLECDEIYSLVKTKCCITVDLSCFCVISSLSPDLVDRPLPHIEPK